MGRGRWGNARGDIAGGETTWLSGRKRGEEREEDAEEREEKMEED